jgi:hypothetical protein
MIAAPRQKRQSVLACMLARNQDWFRGFNCELGLFRRNALQQAADNAPRTLATKARRLGFKRA